MIRQVPYLNFNYFDGYRYKRWKWRKYEKKMRKSHRMHEGFMKASWQQLMAGDACSYMFILFISWHNWYQLTVTDPTNLGRAMVPWCHGHGHELPWPGLGVFRFFHVFPQLPGLPTAAMGSQLTSDVRAPLLFARVWHFVTQVRLGQCDTMWHFCILIIFAYFCLLLLFALSQSKWTDVSFNVQCQDPHRIRVQTIRPTRVAFWVAFSLAWVLRCIAALHLLRHLCLLCPV